MLPPDHARQLAQRLLDGHLALFVGAGISRLAPRQDGDVQRLPLWRDLSCLVAERCHEDPASYRDDPLELFDAIVYGQERAALERAVREILDDRPFGLSDAHRALASLPWSAILTTNYDGLLARLLEERPVGSEDGYDRLSGSDSPRLFQIHGTLDTPHTLTREDYRLWEDSHPRAYRHLESLLLSGTILFVGYSLSDPHIDSLLATVRKITRGREKRMYAWMWQTAEAQVKLLDRRDKIEVVSIAEENGWAQAFAQLAETLRGLQAVGGSGLAPVADAHAYARVQYVQALEARFGVANLQGLYVWGSGYSRADVTLEEIYVEPDLVYFLSNPPIGGEIAALGRVRQEERAGMAFERRERASRVLAREAKLVVVAAPGQGKSTLLRHRLLAAARRWRERPAVEPFPVYVRLSDWEARAEGGTPSLLSYALAMLTQLAEIGSDAARSWTSGPIVWLLDGIDEVRDPFERERLREEVVATAALRPRDRWVVATRPAGEPTGGFAMGWRRAEMPPLNEPGVQQVIARWARVLERKEDVHLDPGEIHRTLERDQGLRRLRGNPLLLTLAVLFYKARHRLPHDRWEFYEAAEQVLRDSWVHHRLRHAAEHLPGTYLPELLERLALSGMEAGRVLFTTVDLERECRDVLDSRGYDGKARDGEIHLFLRAAEDLIGILVAQGPGSFGFLHLTFQEFLTGRALSHRSDQVPELLGRFWDYPDWQEVWSLYALAIQSTPARQAELFREILAHPHPLDNTHLQRHRLACLRLCGVGETALPETALEVTRWAAHVLEEGPEVCRDQVLQILAGWNRASFPDPLRSVLLRRTAESSPVRARLVTALTPAIGESEVRRVVVERLADEKAEVRSAAVFALAAGLGAKEVRREILARLTDPHPAVRKAAGAALSAWVGDEEVRRKFLSLLKESPDNEQLMAVQALAAMVPVDEGLRRELLTWLEEGEPLLRREVATVLSVATGEAEVRQGLLARLGDSDARVRTAAAYALASEAEEEEVWRALAISLRDKNAGVRRAAAHALARIAQEEEVRRTLLSRLRDRNQGVVAAAVTALSAVVGDPQVLHAIRDLLASKKASVRAAAVQALSPMAGEEDGIRRVFIALLRDADLWVSTAAVEALSGLAAQQDVAEALAACLGDSARIVRHRAAEALSAVADTEFARGHLLLHLEDDDPIMRCAVSESLALAVRDHAVRRALLLRLTDEEGSVRFAAADALRGVAQEEEVRAALLILFDDEDWDVRAVAFEIVSESIAQI
jgi:HEAT repeat protein